MTTVPRFPVYIPSKSRAKTATTPRVLDRIGIPYRLIVEEQQVEEYADEFGRDRLLVLDPEFQRSYDTCDGIDHGLSRGSGPARNFAWEHSIAEGHAWHWVIDDNITLFARKNRNQRIPVGDGQVFHAMEEFVLRYRNVGQAGPEYWMFAMSRNPIKPFSLNCRIFSCILLRNDLPVRWRGRYNEDLDLSIQILRAGWCTIKFNAFLQYKLTTQSMAGGNTEDYQRDGTGTKSRLAVRMNPDIVRLAYRYGRAHHQANFSRFDDLRLIRREDYELPEENPYRSRLRPAGGVAGSRTPESETGTSVLDGNRNDGLR